MNELLATLKTAAGLAKKIGKVNAKLKHAEIQGLIGDLTLAMADVKAGIDELLAENDALKQELASIKNADGDPCPKCRKRTYIVEKSTPDQLFAQIGGVMRTYLCSECGFTEDLLILPGM